MPLRVDCFLLADAAQEANGKLHILGGGWNQLFLADPSVPFPGFSLAIRIIVPWEDTNHPVALIIQLHGPDGKLLLDDPPRIELTVGRPPGLSPGSEQALPLAMSFSNMQFEQYGTHAFTIGLEGDGSELFRTRFDVVQRSR